MSTSAGRLFLVITLSIAAYPVDAGSEGRADQATTQGKTGQSISASRQALKADPGNAAAHAQLAQDYEKTGRHEKAEQHVTRALHRNPSNVDALLLMGRIQARQGNWIQVRDYYQQALAVEADNPSAWLGLGHALGQIGDVGGADAAYDEYLKLTASPQ